MRRGVDFIPNFRGLFYGSQKARASFQVSGSFLRRKGGELGVWLDGAAAGDTHPERPCPMPGGGSSQRRPKDTPAGASSLPCPGAQRCTKQLASERSSSALCTTASQNQGIGPSRPQGCGGARDGRRVPQGRQRKKIPASLFSVEKTKCLPHAKPMICNQARRPSTNSQRYQNDSRHSGIGLW